MHVFRFARYGMNRDDGVGGGRRERSRDGDVHVLGEPRDGVFDASREDGFRVGLRQRAAREVGGAV